MQCLTLFARRTAFFTIHLPLYLRRTVKGRSHASGESDFFSMHLLFMLQSKLTQPSTSRMIGESSI